MLAKNFTIQTDGETQSFTQCTYGIRYSDYCSSRSNHIPCVHSASTMYKAKPYSENDQEMVCSRSGKKLRFLLGAIQNFHQTLAAPLDHRGF